MNIEASSGLLAEPPSRNAMEMAKLRAAHQLLDHPLIFDDPLALRILGPETEAIVRRELDSYNTGFGPMLRLTIAMRSRLAEDALVDALRAGVRQYVVLGAGLDSLAYRHHVPGLRVFEIDHPATQSWKRTLLSRCGIGFPHSLRYVPFDFEHAILATTLTDAGCELDQPIFFSWLGVTIYLSHQAIDATLRFVASLPAQSGIVFDYGVLPELLPPLERMGMAHFAKRHAHRGEPWKSYFDPAKLEMDLQAAGFSSRIDYSVADLQARYSAAHADGARIGGGTRLMWARI